MKAFLEKYMDSFDTKEAIKMINNKLLKAVEYSKKDEEKALKCLAEVSNMIDDLFDLKDVDIHSYKRMQ